MSSPQESVSQPFRWHFDEIEDHEIEIHGRTLYFILVLFIIVLILSLLVIYWRWICRCRSDPPPISSHATILPPPPPPRGLDPAAIRALPVTLVANRNIPENDCPICLAVFRDGDKVKVLPQCRHSYHSDCVDKWLNTESSCPLCRSSICVDAELSEIVTQ